MTKEKLVYIPDFYAREADELLDFIRTLPHVRPINKLSGGHSHVRRLSFPGYAPDPAVYRTAMQRENAGGTVMDAPPLYQKLTANLTASAGTLVNYASTIGYLMDDYMHAHQHKEDRVREDQRVWVVSLGAVHPIAIHYGETRDVVNPKTGHTSKKFVPDGRKEIFYPAHGSLYILPSSSNRVGSGNEAEHEVLPGNDRSYGGLRISINCKHIPAGLTPEEFDLACSRYAGRTNAHSGSLNVREPGPPRIYHASGKFPEGAVYCGRGGTFMGRYFPKSPYGNHNRCDRDTEEGRAAFDAYAAAKLQDAAFREEFEKLRGKDLICHCTPKQIREGRCHATVWLRLANS
jgi:hypothetical protein